MKKTDSTGGAEKGFFGLPGRGRGAPENGKNMILSKKK